MKIKCDYCDNYISDTDEVCPNCNAPNAHLKRTSNETPKTIDDLKKWYIDHNLPDENITRFFIGKDIKEARAFGIYYDENSGEYVVYKNKDDGTRAVRYNGKDEAYAVNELYIKLKEEIVNQKQHNLEAKLNPTFRSDRIKKRKKSRVGNIILWAVMLPIYIVPLFFIGLLVYGVNHDFNSGYYAYNDKIYYSYNSCVFYEMNRCEWYEYNQSGDSWSIVEAPSGIKSKNYIAYSIDDFRSKYDGPIVINRLFSDEDWYKDKHPTTPSSGYYIYNNKKYYYFHGWYIYDNGWRQTEADSNLNKYHSDYYTNDYDTYNSYGSESFYDTDYYKNYDYSSSHKDSSSSWDSGSTDWSSDW